MSEFRGRGSRGRITRGRGPIRGGPRSSSRGGYISDRESRGGFSRGRGSGFSRGRGGPPPRHLSRDDSPPRKVPMMSRGYDSERGRGPPVDRRLDRYDDGYDRGIPSRGRDGYSSPPRDTGRLIDRLTPPPRGSLRDRDHGLRGGSDYPNSRGDFLAPRSYSPPPRESGSYRDSYGSSLREERRDSFSRPGLREYSSRSGADYLGDRGRDFRDSPRDYGSGRDYPPSRGEFREPLSGRGEFREREYPSSRAFSRPEGVRIPGRGPPSREYGGPRGGLRGGRDERGGGRGRGGFLNGTRGRGGPPRGRGRPDFHGPRRSPISSRDGPLGKRPRVDEEGYSRR